MEPVKGGSLATLSEDIAARLRAVQPEWSLASWAMRWVAELENCRVILSGMSDEEQVRDNLRTFESMRPLREQERQAIDDVRKAIEARVFVGCTACRYCMPCPFGVDIPRNFRIMNDFAMYNHERRLRQEWNEMDALARADQCRQCGQCERACPQGLPIREKLAQIARRMQEEA